MKQLPIVRLFVYVSVMVIVTAGLGFGVCQETNNVTAMSVVMLLSLAIGMALIFRWWIPVNRAMGVPSPKVTGAQWLIVGALFASSIITVIIEHFVYQRTHNRFAEAVAAISVFVPVGFFILPLAYRRAQPVTANEFQLSRLNYYMQFGLVVIFGLNLCLQLTERHVDTSLRGMQDWVIAMYFAYFVLSPFAIATTRRRFLEAKALKENAPPDRWQAYNERLARNE
jgi:CBS domain containing-hemolysin-like protein